MKGTNVTDKFNKFRNQIGKQKKDKDKSINNSITKNSDSIQLSSEDNTKNVSEENKLLNDVLNVNSFIDKLSQDINFNTEINNILDLDQNITPNITEEKELEFNKNILSEDNLRYEDVFGTKKNRRMNPDERPICPSKENIFNEENDNNTSLDNIIKQTNINKEKENENNLVLSDNKNNKKKLKSKQKNGLEKQLEEYLELEKSNNKNNEEDNLENDSNDEKEDTESQFKNIKNILGKDIVKFLMNQQWEIKKKGFELINEFIDEKNKNEYDIIELIDYIQLKLKNFKETNFNINREAINIFTNMNKKKLMPNNKLMNIILAYYDKLADTKLKDNITELINTSFNIIIPSNLLKQLIPLIIKKNNTKLNIEYSNLLKNIINQYDIKTIPVKDIIDLCKIMVNNTNPQSRTSGINLLCTLYKFLGKDIKIFLTDIKESTMKTIENEFEKISPSCTNKNTENEISKKKSSTNNDNENAKNFEIYNENLPYVDISEKITPQIIKYISDGKWNEKKEACENIEKILIEANMKILPNGLNALMHLIKKKLTDGNKNIVRMIVNLLSKLIEALKDGFEKWTKPIALSLIPNLSDKNQTLRNECQQCLDKWVTYSGFENIIIYFPQFLKIDNIEIRTEILNFFIKYKEKFNKIIGDPVFKDMTYPLLLCLQDRSINIRNMAEEIIKFSLNYISLNNYYKKTKEFKPVISNDLKQILDKIKETLPNRPATSELKTSSVINLKPNTIKLLSNNTNELSTFSSTIIKSGGKNNNVGNNTTRKQQQTHQISHKIPMKNNKSSFSVSKDNDEKIKEKKTKKNSMVNIDPKFNTMSNFNNKLKKESNLLSPKNNNNGRSLKQSSATKKKRVINDEDFIANQSTSNNEKTQFLSNSTILRQKNSLGKKTTQKNLKLKTNSIFINNIKVIPNKAKRLEKDKKEKFSLETTNKEYLNKIKELCKGLFTEDFSKKIFSDDFRKEIEALKEMKTQVDKKLRLSGFLDNLDIILKIISIKITNNINPSLIKNLLDFLDSIYLVLLENNYKLNETESLLIVAILIERFSLTSQALREQLLNLMNQYVEFIDANKIMLNVLSIALTKNNKIKTDILDYTIDLHMNQKLNICNKNYAKIICKFIAVNDNIVKSKALILIKEMFNNMGDKIWGYMELSEKDKEYLENNIFIEDDDDEEEVEVHGDISPKNIEGNSRDNNLNTENINNKNDNTDKNLNKVYLNTDNNERNSTLNYKTLNINNNSESKLKIIEGKISQQDLIETINSLLSEDQTEKVNTIIILHEILCTNYNENKDIAIANINEIVNIFNKECHQLFIVKDIKTIPVKYAKYLSTVLCKMASNKELLSKLKYQTLFELSKELLNFLLIKDLDKIGDNQEGNIIFKSLNSTMLRVLENCETSLVIAALLEILKEYQIREDKNLITLAIKCLLKTSHSLNKEKENMKTDKIFYQIYLMLKYYQKQSPDLNGLKNPVDLMIIKTIKNIISDIVKVKKSKILDEYNEFILKNQINDDTFIIKWVNGAIANLKE